MKWSISDIQDISETISVSVYGWIQLDRHEKKLARICTFFIFAIEITYVKKIMLMRFVWWFYILSSDTYWTDDSMRSISVQSTL